MSWTNPRPYKSPSHSPKLEIDPTAPGTTIRRAFLAEAVLNLFTLPLLISPARVLALLADDPRSITPLACTLGRCFAAMVVGALTPALLLGLPNTRQGIESRRNVYYLLGAGEVALIPLLLWEGLRGESGTLTTKVCFGAVGNLLPPLLWRAYCLFWKPEVFGRYREVAEKEE